MAPDHGRGGASREDQRLAKVAPHLQARSPERSHRFREENAAVRGQPRSARRRPRESSRRVHAGLSGRQPKGEGRGVQALFRYDRQTRQPSAPAYDRHDDAPVQGEGCRGITSGTSGPSRPSSADRQTRPRARTFAAFSCIWRSRRSAQGPSTPPSPRCGSCQRMTLRVEPRSLCHERRGRD
jgi:hypothetical protein